MKQGDFLLIAGLTGLIAYMQAKETGWRVALGALVPACIALIAYLSLTGSEVWSDLRKRQDFSKIMFCVTLAIAGTVFLADVLSRQRRRWNLMPRQVGSIAFFGIYAQSNVAFLILRLKETS